MNGNQVSDRFRFYFCVSTIHRNDQKNYAAQVKIMILFDFFFYKYFPSIVFFHCFGKEGALSITTCLMVCFQTTQFCSIFNPVGVLQF